MKNVRFTVLDKINLFPESFKLDSGKVNSNAKAVIAAVLTTVNDAGVSLAPAQRIQKLVGISNHLWASATKGVDASGFLHRVQRKDARAGRQYFWLVASPGESLEDATIAALASMRTLPLPTNLTYRARHLAALYTLEKVVLGVSSVDVPDVETPDDEALEHEVLAGEALQGETLPAGVLAGEGLSLLSSSSSCHNPFLSREVAAATRTHEHPPVSAQTREPAAADHGQLLKDEPKASTKPTAATQDDEPSEALVQEVGTQLASRMASLVSKPGKVTPSMVRPALRSLKRWAGGDEGQVKAYLADELDRLETREIGEKVSNASVLMRWIADKKSWSRWLAAASETVAAPGSGAQRDKSIPVGRMPRAGMRWNPLIGRWEHGTESNTGVFPAHLLAAYGATNSEGV